MDTLRYGDTGSHVQILQMGLARAGMDPGPQDGIFREQTRTALQAFQIQAGLTPTGIAGPYVWEALHPYLVGYRVHTTVRGDTLYRLARQYHTRLGAILTANPQIDPGRLRIGQAVIIPLGFPVVPTDIAYSSALLELVLEGLRARFPFLTMESVGRSVLGRPLYMITMGEGEREVFYNAAHHANEWITTPLLLAFLEAYARAYGEGGLLSGMDAAALYSGVTLRMVPMVNPDGVDLVTGALDVESDAYTQALNIAQNYPGIPFPSGWKANIRGVDLNLNYPAEWNTAREIKAAQGFTGPAPRDYVGPNPLSEPETQAIHGLTLDHDFQLILAYHSQGELIYWKFLDYEPARSFEIAQDMARASGHLVEEVPLASGYAGYKDWFIQTYDRPGYTIEVGRGVSPLPLEQFPGIYRDNLGILLIGLQVVADGTLPADQ